jgi:hypothetical protein
MTDKKDKLLLLKQIHQLRQSDEKHSKIFNIIMKPKRHDNLNEVIEHKLSPGS